MMGRSAWSLVCVLVIGACSSHGPSNAGNTGSSATTTDAGLTAPDANASDPAPPNGGDDNADANTFPSASGGDGGSYMGDDGGAMNSDASSTPPASGDGGAISPPSMSDAGSSMGGGSDKCFKVTCANGTFFPACAVDHKTMCQDLASKIVNCPVDATAEYEKVCGGTPPAVDGGVDAILCYDVKCANGSYFNACAGNHAAMCSELSANASKCPAEADAVFQKICK